MFRWLEAIPPWKLITGVSAAAVVVVLLAVLAVFFLRRTDERLLGTWQSDADATIAEWRTTRTVTPDQEVALRKLFGRMRITWDRRNAVSVLDGTEDLAPYRIVKKEGDEIVVEVRSDWQAKDIQRRIRFVGRDTYWVHAEEYSIWECFRRVP